MQRNKRPSADLRRASPQLTFQRKARLFTGVAYASTYYALLRAFFLSFSVLLFSSLLPLPPPRPIRFISFVLPAFPVPSSGGTRRHCARLSHDVETADSVFNRISYNSAQILNESNCDPRTKSVLAGRIGGGLLFALGAFVFKTRSRLRIALSINVFIYLPLATCKYKCKLDASYVKLVETA